ncbi:MAG: sigma-54 dependent transcriptional regulator [Gammaproteobacteria bacterium]|nr:sigma-54 dependent transcriptional regulator [Gammaproteobacteria bacterium]MCW9056899.1 sigma-54 dependent transcriptional regulator [Gammaproteobacteria bacterium]
MKAFEQLIGESPEFLSVIRSADIVAATDVTVLIEGDTGTGKELLAQAIHESSNRVEKPFVTINCAALPESLVESELFGHKKGAFTGAVNDQAGYIKQAEGGTLFLDEIGELSLAVQAKLLRFIEYGECQCVGDSRLQKVDVRLIAATNRNIAEQVNKGLFREDLYYRLKIVPLELPALKQRSADILLIARHFISSLSEQHDLASPKFTPSALKQLQNYSWPGNVRELRNLCERLVVLLPGQEITEHNLPVDIVQKKEADSGRFKLPSQGLNLEMLETDLLKQALGLSQGNKSRAARLLGISRDAFLYRLKKYSI